MGAHLFLGDIFESDAEIIVNPANGHLAHGGGLARNIADRANRRRWFGLKRNTFQRECDEAPPIPTGSAYMTSAGALKFERVVHAVGPVWTPQEAHHASALVEQAYLSAMDLAMRERYHSIAFPAISSGIFGVPIEVVARAAFKAVTRRYYTMMALDCEFWLWTAPHANEFGRVFGQRVRVVT